ncbi:MAG TPA: hypothetical protein VFW33_18540 [Gemmataceae bacterium]|nr:hypothetical protein [Gemmataceae bacterium]
MRSFTGQLGSALSGPANVVPGTAPSAAIKAKRCHFPTSSWVYAFILTCDDKLAVWFKRRPRGAPRGVRVPGVCCLYPRSNRRLYDLAVSWPSAGRFVHRFLYRILAYVLVAPPKSPCGTDCPPGAVVPCCPNALPPTLYVTFTGALASLRTVTLIWNGTDWGGSSAGDSCGGVVVTLSCDVLTDNFLLGTNGGANSGTQADSLSCSPLSIRFDGTSVGGTCLGSFRAVVTT